MRSADLFVSPAFRPAAFALCTLLFLAQSAKEVQKYFSSLTSTSIRTVEEERLRFPILAFCHKMPFKSEARINAPEVYEDNVYTFDDLFSNASFAPALDSGLIDVITLDSLW